MASRFALEELPDWWPEEAVYHGTSLRSFRSIQQEGLCAPVAERASGDDYGWKEVWGSEIYGSYKSDLTKEQRRKLHTMLGLPSGFKMSKGSLGELVSLWWVSKSKRVAEGYEKPTQVDLSKLDYYWWLPDDILGEQSYVFVLPTACPQAPASILKPLTYTREPAKFGYVGLRQWVRDGGRGPVENTWEQAEEEAQEGESTFYDSEAGAYRVMANPIARFPWPKGARLLDARKGIWAFRGVLQPTPAWQWHDERVMMGREGPFAPMPLVHTQGSSGAARGRYRAPRRGR